MKLSFVFFTCFCLGVIPSSNAACHGHHICPGESNTAVENLDLLFSVRLCYTILAFNCDDHILTQDEQVCGDDGITYDNHCLFTQARCRAAPNIHGNAHVTLGVHNHGPCAKDVSTDSNLAVASSTPMPMDTTTAQQLNGTTVDTGNGPVDNDFCKNVDSTTCSGLRIICGSDGTYYFNECEYKKASCKDPTLTQTIDATVCAHAP